VEILNKFYSAILCDIILLQSSHLVQISEGNKCVSVYWSRDSRLNQRNEQKNKFVGAIYGNRFDKGLMGREGLNGL
jgi:hypothetical protein